MLTRRRAIAIVGIAALLAELGLIRRAGAQSGGRAIALVRRTSEQLVAVVDSAGSPQEKSVRLRSIIESAVDVDDIARFCLGRFWRLATVDQRREYVSLFHDLLISEIVGHLGEYRGVRVIMGLARTSEDTEIVITTVERPDNPAMQIDWVVATNTGAPKIIDLLAEGTSMRLTHSADFTAYLARHQYNIHELLEGMRQRIAQN